MNMNPVVSFEQQGRVGVIRVDRPPVNAIDRLVRTGLAERITAALESKTVAAVVLACAGRTFMAGVDIKEFDAPMEPPFLADIQKLIETAQKPVVAAIHGTALGGGLELALACHYRVALEDAAAGLPEIHMGIIPGAGGSQRLPRLIGARAAFEMILSGKPVKAPEARDQGLFDTIYPNDLLANAVAFCDELLHKGKGPRPVSALPVNTVGFSDSDREAILKSHSRALKGRTTQLALVEAFEAAVNLPLDDGLKVELRLCLETLASRESAALRHMFFADRKAASIPNLPQQGQSKPIRSVAVVGAGTMGSGIATAFADAGLPVVLIDSEQAGLTRGNDLIRANYAANVKRGRITEAAAAARIGKIHSSLDMAAAATADVVVEAVFENLDLKKRVLASIDAVVASDALIATNTSSLSVTEMAEATQNAARVVGLHFFSPAHVMPLLEIVRGASSDAAAMAKSLEVARLLRKIGVVSGDAFGFIGNRMMLDGYFREAEQLMLEGASPTDVDEAMEAFGFPMGPNRVSDLAGNDVGTKARAELFKRQKRPDPYFVIADSLTGMGRFGQKSGRGFYSYQDSRTGVPDPAVAELIERLAAERGIRRREIGRAEIQERCVLALINVGAAVLEEGTAQRSSDIDVVWTAGYGFPRYLGGPMFYADSLGMAAVLDRIRHFHRSLGSYWQPAVLLEQLAGTQSSFAKWSGS
jgi:3-hydroxyacyl-CoA dehydrogenase